MRTLCLSLLIAAAFAGGCLRPHVREARDMAAADLPPLASVGTRVPIPLNNTEPFVWAPLDQNATTQAICDTGDPSLKIAPTTREPQPLAARLTIRPGSLKDARGLRLNTSGPGAGQLRVALSDSEGHTWSWAPQAIPADAPGRYWLAFDDIRDARSGAKPGRAANPARRCSAINVEFQSTGPASKQDQAWYITAFEAADGPG